jgi:CRP-like cAMP-binding protein
MDREEHQAGSFLCKSGEKADKLYLIQSGHVDIMTTYDAKQLPFIIERLERGSIINHRSFMVEDEIDTDYLCKDKVSVFVLSTQMVSEVMTRRSDLSKVFSNVESEVLLMQ